jgi:hypothetical protein
MYNLIYKRVICNWIVQWMDSYLFLCRLAAIWVVISKKKGCLPLLSIFVAFLLWPILFLSYRGLPIWTLMKDSSKSCIPWPTGACFAYNIVHVSRVHEAASHDARCSFHADTRRKTHMALWPRTTLPRTDYQAVRGSSLISRRHHGSLAALHCYRFGHASASMQVKTLWLYSKKGYMMTVRLLPYSTTRALSAPPRNPWASPGLV